MISHYIKINLLLGTAMATNIWYVFTYGEYDWLLPPLAICISWLCHMAVFKRYGFNPPRFVYPLLKPFDWLESKAASYRTTSRED